MKKFILLLGLSALIVSVGCGKTDVRPSPSAPQKTAEFSSASPETASPSDLSDKNEPAATKAPDETVVEHIDAQSAADEVIDDGRTENAFLGQWRSVRTTSENSAFTYLELNITEDDYLVTLSFDSGETSSYTGKYELNDGILTFDESFIGCSAYFFDDDIYTLVLDNGTSLVFCEKLTEDEVK